MAHRRVKYFREAWTIAPAFREIPAVSVIIHATESKWLPTALDQKLRRISLAKLCSYWNRPILT